MATEIKKKEEISSKEMSTPGTRGSAYHMDMEEKGEAVTCT